MRAGRQIVFYLDFISPFAYLANAKLPDLAARHGAALIYLPLDVMHAKLATGNFAPSTRVLTGKREFIRRDRLWWAQHYGVPMRTPRAFSAPRLNAGILVAQEQGRVRRYVDAAFHQVWGLGGDPDDDELLATVAEQTGLDRDGFFASVGSPDTTSRVGAIGRDAARRGVFGVPTMIVGEEMFWGNDRLDFLEACLAGFETKKTGVELCQPHDL